MTDANKLALLGGAPVIAKPLAPFVSMGEDEVVAASEVIRGGVLSAYIGAAGDGFMGGTKVKAFEQKAAEYFGVRHAVAVNSWTSGLIAAVGAIGIEPGDEIITSPWTMAATATAILHFNGIPVFADIDPVSFNLDPRSVEQQISPRTRAIMSVDIFGQSADMKALRAIADRHGLKLLCDTAQAPGARYFDRYAGTLADIGGYSLNYHKHIHCGEGGILVTEDDRLATRLRLIRNHAEAVIASDDPAELCNMLGYNFRMGEIEAAIASVQLGKLAGRVESRQRAAKQLDEGLAGLPGLTTPAVSEGCTHVYYVYGITLDGDRIGVPRARLLEALRAEGVPALFAGYQNLHRLPLFRNKISYGQHGFPWTSVHAGRAVSYERGTCPVAERLHEATFLGLNLCMCQYEPGDVALILAAFRKVWAQPSALQSSAA
jgi:perosamine synthetase